MPERLFPKPPATPAASNLPFAVAWQFAQSPAFPTSPRHAV
jgi:hypothetical protein